MIDNSEVYSIRLTCHHVYLRHCSYLRDISRYRCQVSLFWTSFMCLACTFQFTHVYYMKIYIYIHYMITDRYNVYCRWHGFCWWHRPWYLYWSSLAPQVREVRAWAVRKAGSFKSPGAGARTSWTSWTTSTGGATTRGIVFFVFSTRWHGHFKREDYIRLC